MRFLFLLLLSPRTVAAQQCPSKPVRLVIGFAAGGTTDVVGRIVAQKVGEGWGQNMLVENRAGASGMIAADAVAKAAPDGYTLLLSPQTSLAVAPALTGKATYDAARDFTPITVVGSTPTLMVVTPSFPAKSFAEFVAHAKANSGKLNYTSCGPASPQHLAGEMLASQLGFKWQHVPYKGCAPALADVLGNQVPLFISTVAHFNPQIKAGKLRGYAVLTGQRTQFAPEYPAAAESVPGYVVDLWFGLLAPGRTPQPIIARLNDEVNKALRSPELREKLLAGSYEPVGGPPERFAQAIKSDMEKFGKVIKEAGIKPD